MTGSLSAVPGNRDRLSDYRRAMEGLIGIPASEGNDLRVLRNGNEIFPAMLEAINTSKSTIDFLTFVYWQGEIGTAFAEALAARARAGVRVRVLLDAFGSRPIRRTLIRVLEDAGCRVCWFRPIKRMRPSQLNHRTHRKVLICDERVSFTGGVGIADEWGGDARDESEWRDTHVRIEGPATDGLRAAFIDNWADGEPVLFEPGVDRFPDQPQNGESVVQVVRGASESGWNDIATAFMALLQLAEERVNLTTAYFVPGDDLLDQVCRAANRGVEVNVLLPGPHDDKRYVQLGGEADYGTLLECGARVWNFQPSMLHAKILTVDGVVSCLGSANFNHRSTSLDEEVNLVVFDPAIARRLDDDFRLDLERSIEIEPERWEDRGLAQRAKEKAAKSVDAVM